MPAKKKTRPPRVASHLPTECQPLYTRCCAIWANVKADPTHFTNPYPGATKVEGDLAALATAIQGAEGGTPASLVALDAAADTVRETFDLLARYVQSVVRTLPIADVPALLSSVLLYESNLGKRPPKPALELRDGDGTGRVAIIALAVAAAVAYFWDFSVDQVNWTTGGQTPQARTKMAGLTPGKVYYFRFRWLRRDGTISDPSQVVSFMVR